MEGGLSTTQAKAELARLADLLARADRAYHTDDAPVMSDSEYDALKARNAAIEASLSRSQTLRQPQRQSGRRAG